MTLKTKLTYTLTTLEQRGPSKKLHTRQMNKWLHVKFEPFSTEKAVLSKFGVEQYGS